MPQNKQEAKIKAIEGYGQLYVERIIKNQIANKDKIYGDWREALEFLFGKVFYRGRKDELSERFMNATIETLRKYSNLDKNYNPKNLDSQLKSNGVNNGRDRKMVLETLDFIFHSLDSYKNNVVQYTTEKIKAGKTDEVFNTLDNIYAIGDKLASFYIRDVILIYQLENYLKPNDFKYCQPVDTWVGKVAKKINLILNDKIPTNKKRLDEMKEKIIQPCLREKISPLLFNAGAWMVGAKSFELLIENL